MGGEGQDGEVSLSSAQGDTKEELSSG